MALDFPANPSQGDTYATGDTTWQYDGVAWTVIPFGGTVFPNSYATVNVNGTALAADSSGDTLRLLAGTNITLITDSTTKSVTVNAADAAELDQIEFYIAADDSTQRLLSNGETVQFIGGDGITTSTDTEGNITINYTGTLESSFNALTEITTAGINVAQIYESAIVTLRVDNVGTSAYTFNSHYSGNNPTIYAISGTTIAFDLTEINGLPFEIQNNTLTPISTGLVHVALDGTVSTGSNAQGKSSGVLYWRIPETSAGTFVYQCQTQAPMFGIISVKRLSAI